MNRLHFLRRHARQMATPLVGFHQNIVGNNVQLFLRFALNILGACAAQHARQRAFANIHRDGLAGPGDDLDQQPQLRLNGVGRALLLNQKLRKRGAARHGRMVKKDRNIDAKIVARSTMALC